MPIGTNPELEVYLRMIYPWGQEYDGLWRCVTWTFPPQQAAPGATGKPKNPFANFAAQRIEGVMHLIETRYTRAQANVYVGLGMQRMASTDKFSTDGFPRADRTIANIVSFNSVYLDLDVKPGAYVSTEEALAAVEDFRIKVGLPEISMLVASGSGGVHAYWCTEKPIPAMQWSPLAVALRDAALAYGLKFDPQVTVNAAGILRPPTTWNHKLAPPGVVRLLASSFKRYTVEELVAALKVQPVAGALSLAAGAHGVVTSAGVGHSQNFILGVAEAPTPSIEAVAKECLVTADILARGGNGDAEPLWNMAVLLASFTDDPSGAAHKLSNQDPRYTPADTDKKLVEKLNARANNPGLGWPKCSQFAPLHPGCQSCAYFALNKSPLSFAPRPQPQVSQLAAASNVAQHPNPGDPLLPAGYFRDMVSKHVKTRMQDDQGQLLEITVLPYPLYDAAIDEDTEHLVLKTAIRGVDRWVNIAAASAVGSGSKAGEAYAKVGLFIDNRNHLVLRSLTVAWMNRLQELKRTVKPVSLGWTADRSGFAYGDRVYRELTTEVAYRGSAKDDRYEPTGNTQPWLDAVQLAYGSAAHETLVATAFAAPLVELVSDASVVVSAYSPGSGVGKTTMLKIAQAVWGHPVEGMSALIDTDTSVVKKAADLHSLPLYWDELSTKDRADKVVQLVFQLTQGKGKAKLTRDSHQMHAGKFSTLMLMASNYGVSDLVYSNTIATDAGGIRVFEIEIPKHVRTVATWQGEQLVKPLGTNFGNVGRTYAEFLARNRKTIQQALVAYAAQLDHKLAFKTNERFWATTMQVLGMSAKLANAAGLTRFDVAAIDSYLEQSLTRLRGELKDNAATTLIDQDARPVLMAMIAWARGNGNLLTTETIPWPGAGRPVALKVVDTLLDRLKDVWIQNGSTDGRVRVVKTEFDTWMQTKGYNPKQIVNLLSRHYMVSRSKQTIGAGVQIIGSAAGQRHCYDFGPKPTSPGSSPGSSSPTSP